VTLKEFSWWTFYVLFLAVVLFLLFLLVRSLIGGALGRVSNLAEVVYLIGLGMAVLGLMGMCIVYVARTMWFRLKGGRGE
jgi:hypothetical protein